MRYQAIVFDVSDTLVRYWPNYAELYSQRLRAVGIDVGEGLPARLSKAVYHAGGEQTRREQNGAPRLSDRDFNRLLDEAALSCASRLPDSLEALLDKLEAIPLPQQQMYVIDGVPAMLEELKRRGYRLAIVSNHHTWLLDFLKQAGLADFFESIIISETVGVEKPNVRIMQLALDALALDASSCLYVGDHPLDVLCAKEARMDMAWITEPDSNLQADIPYTEDYRIASALDVVGLLDAWLQ